MSLVAIVPLANILASNASLNEAGFGSPNFSVAAYTGPAATHAALHAWADPAFEAAVSAIVGVTIDNGEVPDPEAASDPVSRTKALIEAQGAKWGAQAAELPSDGVVAAGSMWNFDGSLWSVIQAFNRSTYGAHPSTYPALIRRVRQPNVREAWRQPLDQFDSYNLINPFTGQADECTHVGKDWYTTRNTNVWEPGTPDSGWVEVGQEAPSPNEWPDFVQPTGAQDAYAIGAKVTFNALHYSSKINANVWSPIAYPAGWQLEP